MAQALRQTSIGQRVGLAVGSSALMVFGGFATATASDSWGGRAVATVAVVCGALGFVWVASDEAGRRGRLRPPWWLALLGAAVVVAAVLIGTVGAVCNDAEGFSCGG